MHLYGPGRILALFLASVADIYDILGFKVHPVFIVWRNDKRSVGQPARKGALCGSKQLLVIRPSDKLHITER